MPLRVPPPVFGSGIWMGEHHPTDRQCRQHQRDGVAARVVFRAAGPGPKWSGQCTRSQGEKIRPSLKLTFATEAVFESSLRVDKASLLREASGRIRPDALAVAVYEHHVASRFVECHV